MTSPSSGREPGQTPEVAEPTVVWCGELQVETRDATDKILPRQALVARAGIVAQCRAQIERIEKTGIQQIAIIPYSPPGGSREETIRGFAKAMR